MHNNLLLIAIVSLGFQFPAAAMPDITLDKIAPHPRLFLSPEDITRLRSQIKSDPVSAKLFAALRSKADASLDAPLLVRKMEGRRLLGVSREAIERISALALLGRLTDDPRYARRAESELVNVSGFSDWNPDHFLDTASMAIAVSVGLDWLYDSLSPETKAILKTALREKALLPSIPSSPKMQTWITRENNWNQVCHAGMTIAALASYENDPDLAEKIIRRAIENLHFGASVYAPDGAYPEGPSYWNFGTSYHVFLVAALESALGRDFGLADFPGFAASAEYIQEITAPSGEFYSYSDSRPTRPLSPALFWFARRFNRPDYLALDLARLNSLSDSWAQNQNRMEKDGYLALLLIWWKPESGAKEKPNLLPLNWQGRGHNPVAVHRTAWADPRAVFVGFKGGSPGISHGQMDVASFVLESDGIRWALDLGADDYHRLESNGFADTLWNLSPGSQRWHIFRIGPGSHNLMVFDDAEPNAKGTAGFTHFSTEKQGSHSVLEAGTLWPGKLKNYSRGIALLPDRRVLIQDEWTAGPKEINARWQWLTRATVTIEGPNQVILEQDGHHARLVFDWHGEVRFKVSESSLLEHPYDTPNPGVRRLDVALKSGPNESGRLRVLFIPESSSETSDLPPPIALSNWSKPLLP